MNAERHCEKIMSPQLPWLALPYSLRDLHLLRDISSAWARDLTLVSFLFWLWKSS